MQRLIIVLIMLFVLASCKLGPSKSGDDIGARYTGMIAQKAAVVSAHPEASRVGLEILKKGGNAIDAAVAVQMALAVTYPVAGNLGGGGFMVIRLNDGKTHTLDFREIAPSAAHRDMYLDEKGEVVPRLSLDGHLAVGVPGTVDGCVMAHRRFGKLKWAELIEPSIALARDGFIVTKKQAARLAENRSKFEKHNIGNSYLQESIAAGSTLKQEDLAETLTLIKQKGRAGFYEGPVADLFVEEMKKGGGIIKHDDLKNYASKWREAVTGSYKDYKIISMPPPSSGGVALIQILNLLEDYPLSDWGFHDVQSVHCITEVERLVYADRASHLGDPDFWKVPVEGLLDKQYLKQRKALINTEEATRSDEIKAGNPAGAEGEQTTHFSIVDEEGNAVSVTTTLNGAYGSKTFVSGAGFLLNNEMDDFSSKPGVPNMYGLVGGEANAIAPGKRMLSSMTPTIVEKNGDLFMVVGTPGGSTIITSVAQTILNVIEFDKSMGEAVNALRFHHQWLPDSLFIEEGALGRKTIKKLTKMGHRVKARDPIGRVDAILVRENGELEGGADIRGDDTALGY